MAKDLTIPIRTCRKLLCCQKATSYLLFYCLMPVSVVKNVMPGCHLQQVESSGFSRDGDILIGGIIPLHDSTFQPEITFQEEPEPVTCQIFGLQNFQWLQAMVFAIEEINNNTNLLPNITLGFQIYDSCRMLQRALMGSLWILTGQEKLIVNYRCNRQRSPAAIIGELASTCSILLARILSLYRYPQISYFSTSPLLSDRKQFPSFFRTISSDDFQSRGLVEVLMYFGWTWVGILAADDDYGQHGSQIVQQELNKSGSCVAFSEKILTSRVDKNAFHIVQVIKNSTANAIVIFSSNAHLFSLLDEIGRRNVTNKIWIASEAWSTSSLLAVRKYSDILAGTIGFAIHSREMMGFQDYFMNINPFNSVRDTFVRHFWEEAFGCQWLDQKNTMISGNTTKQCTGAEKLGSLPINSRMDFRVTYNIYKAVYATALALEDLRMCVQSGGPLLRENCGNISDFHPWQLLQYIKAVRVRRGDTAALFDEHGNSPALYDIVNWQQDSEGTIRHVKVGSYDSSAPPGKIMSINASAIQWAAGNTHVGEGTFQVPVSVCSPRCPSGFRKAAKPGKPICCFQCVPCILGEISNLTDSIECFKCPWDEWPNGKHDRCIPKIKDFLSYKGTLGAMLAIISIFFAGIPIFILALFMYQRNTPIIKASNSNLCYLLLLSLVVCFLCSLAFIGYPTQEKCLLRQAAFGISFSVCVSCILAKTIVVVIAFNATKPHSGLRRWIGPRLSYIIISVSTFIQILLSVLWLVLDPPFSKNNIDIQPGIIIVECNEGSPVAFWCMLGYLGVLAIISFIVAFLARKLPDSFNEAKFITFSLLAFLSVWISFIPAYLSTRGKYMVAMEIFAILASSLSLVCGIFLPKCYNILFKSEMNTKECLMGKGGSQNKKVKRM